MQIKEQYRPGACPHCGAKTGNNTTDVYLYGSPIRTCSKCKGQYLNKCYHEVELDGYCDADVSVEVSKKNVRNSLLVFGAIVVMNVLFYILQRYSWMYLLFAGLGGLLLVLSIKDYIKVKKGTRQKELEKERQASVARLSDPAYAQALKALGYDVPEKYLSQSVSE